MNAMTVPPEVLRRLVRSAGGEPGSFRARPMPGGASTRRFFRIDMGGGRTAVAMYIPDANGSDEIVTPGARRHRWPFLEIRDLLESRGVRVPSLIGTSIEEGLILVEDLGDDTLAQHVARIPAHRDALYRQAVADIARAQDRLRSLPAGSIVASRAFDRDLLRRELQHFEEWAIDARGIALSRAERTRFRAIADHVATEIASWPRGFVHRDYQSRNLMVRKGRSGLHLVWIDFQDALLGPRVYDLVALLNDSYQTFTPEFVELRLDEFATLRELDPSGRAALGREFDLVTVQRKLKDAGRFVYIDRVKGDPDYLRYVDPTIDKALTSLARLGGDPAMADLAGILARTLRA